jgi:hypothetical protein
MSPHRTIAMSLLATVSLCLALAAAARAGTYDVVACDAAGGANNSWTPYITDSYWLATESFCPSAGRPDYGIIGRTRTRQGRVPQGSFAKMLFIAPGGASVVGLTHAVNVDREGGSGWRVGLDTSTGAFPLGCGAPYEAGCTMRQFGLGATFTPIAPAGAIGWGIQCVAAGGCATGGPSYLVASANMYYAAVRVQDDSPPAMWANAGELWGDGWHRRTEQAWSGYADNVGVRLIRLVVDGAVHDEQDFNQEGWPPWVRCDYTLRRPCHDIPNGGLTLDTSRLPDGAHTLRLDAFDAAWNPVAHERTILVDNTPPASPQNVTVAGGEGWRTTNGFEVGWTNPGGQVSPIAAAHWQLCRVGDPGSCAQGQRRGGDVRALGLAAPGSGDWVLRVWLEDEAGNASPALAGDPVHLRLDEVAPETAGFELQDPGDPRRLRLAALDRHSGLAAASIQLRARGATEWRDLPTVLERSGRATARVPDLELPDGAYDVRAVLRDVAGNEAVVDRDVSGRLRTRISSVVGAAPPRRCRTVRRRVSRRRVVTRRVCSPVTPRPAFGAPLRLGFGRAATVRASVLTVQGSPVAHAVVDVLARLRSEREWRPAGTVRADGAGRFAYRVGPGASRNLRFAFGGDDLLLPAAAELPVFVPAAGTLAVDRRRARNGGRVVFTGRLLGRPVPPGGRTVDLQAHYRGAWRTFATPRTDSRGRWRYPYRFGATRGRVIYRFRALIKREAAYPYEQGATPVVSVVVTG